MNRYNVTHRIQYGHTVYDVFDDTENKLLCTCEVHGTAIKIASALNETEERTGTGIGPDATSHRRPEYSSLHAPEKVTRLERLVRAILSTPMVDKQILLSSTDEQYLKLVAERIVTFGKRIESFLVMGKMTPEYEAILKNPRPFRFDSERVEMSRSMFKDVLFDTLNGLGARIADLLEKGDTGDAVYMMYEFMERKVNG